jgi:hypothetical protein
MRKIVLAAAVALVGLSAVPALAHDGYFDRRYDAEIRGDIAAIEHYRAELRRDLWAHRHGAANWREIEVNRRALRRAERELQRDLARRGW